MIDDVLEKLDPKLRKLLGTGSEFHIDRQVLPSAGLTKALGGGLGYGRQVLLYGSKAAGKSTMLLQMIGIAQKDGKTAAWIDSEDSFDPEWARRLGVDTDALIVVNTKKINDVVDVGTELMKAGIDIIVIDSISALMPAVYFEKDGSLKDLSDTKQMGADARDMTQAVKMLNYANDKTLLILVSQQRKKLGSMFVSNIPTGGEAVKYFSSTIIKLFTSETENNAIKAKIDIGGREIEKVVARKVNWTIEANKLGPAFESGDYRLVFVGDTVGVDSSEELVSLLEQEGHVQKGGAWYTVLESRFQGREAIVNAIRSDASFRARAEQVLQD
jgi:recombination protein RecA